MIVQIGLEILTFLLLGNLYETLAGLFEILATPLFEGFDAKFPTVFNDFNVAISNWEILASRVIRGFIIITLELVRGKSADGTTGFLLPHEV